MKKLFTLLLLATGWGAMAQNVGINTAAPKATLDISGTSATVAEPDGFIPASLTRAQLIAKTAYGTDQTGTLIYVSDVSGTTNAATADVIAAGYYSFNGIKWVGLRPKFQGFLATKNDSYVKPATDLTGPVPFNIKVHDPNNWFDSATGQFKPTTAGYYQIKASLKLDEGGGGGRKFVVLYKNGGQFFRGTALTGSNTSSSLSALVYLNGVSDYVDLYVLSLNANTTTVHDPLYSYFQGYLVSAQ